MSRGEETRAILLRELNISRAKLQKAPLETYPEIGCTSCGELPTANEGLFETAVPDIRTCEKCVLDGYPFRKSSVFRLGSRWNGIEATLPFTDHRTTVSF